MKKIILISLLSLISLLFVPLITNASLDTNLYYGLRNNGDVRELQEFLIDKGFLTGSATGNFYSLTLKAVKAYQTSSGINSTGYVGALTRIAVNNELVAQLSGSNTESTTTGTTPPAPTPQATTNDVISNLQAQITLLMQQLTAMQAQQTTVQQLQQTVQQQTQTIQQIQQNTQQTAQNTQQIAQNTTLPPDLPLIITMETPENIESIFSFSPQQTQMAGMTVFETTINIQNKDTHLEYIKFKFDGLTDYLPGNPSYIYGCSFYIGLYQFGAGGVSPNSNGYVVFNFGGLNPPNNLLIGDNKIKLKCNLLATGKTGVDNKIISLGIESKNDLVFSNPPENYEYNFPSNFNPVKINFVCSSDNNNCL